MTSFWVWVETTSSAAFKVDIPAQDFQAVPPSIAVVNGWNLVPVVVLNSDAHAPGDLLTEEFAMSVALGAGLDLEEAESLLGAAPLQLLEKVGVERGH